MIKLEKLPINDKRLYKLFDRSTCCVAVNYCIITKDNNIVKYGSSRPCGCNHRQCSIHAEQIAMRYCLRNINKNYKIIIWRWGKCGNLKEKYCCHGCTKMIKKYGYENKIFTILDTKYVSAINVKPEISLNYIIRDTN